MTDIQQKDEELKTAAEILYEHGIDTLGLKDDFNSQLFSAMERYAEQYTASKIKDLQKDLDLAISEIVKLQMNQINQ